MARMVRTLCGILTSASLLIGCKAVPQEHTSQKIEQNATTASCSNVVVTGGTSTFTCSGLSREQADILKDIPGTLTKLLKQGRDLSTLKALVNTEIRFNYEFSSTRQAADGPLTITIGETATPLNNVAKSLRVMRNICIIKGDFSNPIVAQGAEKELWAGFVRAAQEGRAKAASADFSLGTRYRIADDPFTLSQTDFSEMLSGQRRVYIVSAAWWINASGSRDLTAMCVYLGTDGNSLAEQSQADPHPPLHICHVSPDDF